MDRALTLVFPGSISYDGEVYRAFKPYALLANSLCDRFRKVIVCTQIVTPDHSTYGGSDTEIDSSIEVQPLPQNPEDDERGVGYQIRRASALLRLLRRWDLTYVFIPSYPGAIAYTVIRLGYRKPVAVYLANDWEEITPYTFRGRGWKRMLFPLYQRILPAWERWIMRTAPLALTAGRALHEKYGGNGRPVHETAPVLEMSSDDMFRRDPAVLSDPARLLYVGSLVPRKGLPILLSALGRLEQDIPGFELDIVGQGSDGEALRCQVEELGLVDRVTFHGFVPNGPDLYRFYRRADAFVLPTFSEGFPRVLYEALGHSLPVIASAVSGIPKLLQDREHALLVPPGDPMALAEAVREVLTDADLRRRIATAGYDLVRPIIASDPADQFVDLYHRYLGPGSS